MILYRYYERLGVENRKEMCSDISGDADPTTKP
jgi:hypothetical protein